MAGEDDAMELLEEDVEPFKDAEADIAFREFMRFVLGSEKKETI